METMLKRLTDPLYELVVGEVSRRAGLQHVSRRAETAAELEAMFRRFVFPELPERERRHDLLARLEGTGTSEALYVIAHLHRSLGIDGDVCEFGVAQGATSALIANELLATEKHLWLFDSFAGLPKPSAKDVLIHDIFKLGSIARYEGRMAFTQRQVLRRLRAVSFPPSRVTLVPGFIEETVRRADVPRRVCFAYVDFDFYQPIKTALEYLDGVVPPGGLVLVDDYGWFSAGAQAAVDEFVAAHRGRWDVAMPLPFAGHFAVLARVASASPGSSA
jgi:hypothetical protein